MKISTLRWTIQKASVEFKIDRETLSKRIKHADIQAHKDGTFTTQQICAAVYGDLHGERLRNERLDADLKQIKLAEAEGHLLPIEHIESAWGFVVVNLRQRILHHQKLTEDIKRDLLRELKDIPIDDYRPSQNAAKADDSDACVA
jgi:hypothetical protein